MIEDEWFPWDGRPHCPPELGPHTHVWVDVKTQCGGRVEAIEARELRWFHVANKRDARYNPDGNIVAWRYHVPT